MLKYFHLMKYSHRKPAKNSLNTKESLNKTKTHMYILCELYFNKIKNIIKRIAEP